MSQSLASVKLFATLFLFWLLLNGSLAPDVLLFGLLAAGALTLLLPESLCFLTGYRLLPRSYSASAGFVIYFLKEIVKSNLALAAVVLSPALPINPAIVRVRTQLKEPVARLLLANAITLTPGTLTVEMKGEWLYVHWVMAQDSDNATDAIVRGYERYLEVMYG